MTNYIVAGSVGALTAGGVLAQGALNSQTQVPLGEAISVFIFVCGVVWYLKGISDDIKIIKRDLKKLPCHNPLTGTKCPDILQKKMDKLKEIIGPSLDEETSTT